MLNNADQVEQLLQTNGKAAKAQVGYDLTLKEVKQIVGGTVLCERTEVDHYHSIETVEDIYGRDVFSLQPGTYSLTFEQGVILPSGKTAFIRHRSSILRCGAIITSGVYDPSFYVDEMGAVLIVTRPITIQKGARVAQIIVFDNNDAEAYNGQWLGEKDYK